jgi:hypothetical protein
MYWHLLAQLKAAHNLQPLLEAAHAVAWSHKLARQSWATHKGAKGSFIKLMHGSSTML